MHSWKIFSPKKLVCKDATYLYYLCRSDSEGTYVFLEWDGKDLVDSVDLVPHKKAAKALMDGTGYKNMVLFSKGTVSGSSQGIEVLIHIVSFKEEEGDSKFVELSLKMAEAAVMLVRTYTDYKKYHHFQVQARSNEAIFIKFNEQNEPAVHYIKTQG